MLVVGRVSRALTGRIALVAAVAALLAACSSSAGTSPGAASTSAPAPVVQPSDKLPNSVAVLGHSGTTGFDSDPAARGNDARQHSWATGDNPDVNSIYLRLLALNPAVRGHNLNVGVAGTGVDELVGQADQALAANPPPELFLIQSVDNAIRCDGTDTANYAPFAATLTQVVGKISAAAPKAKILFVSSPPGDNHELCRGRVEGPEPPQRQQRRRAL